MADTAPKIKSQSPVQSQGGKDAELIASLFELADAQHNPWRLDFNKQVVECYQFTELNQWESTDMRLLALAGIPTIAVDFVNRNIDGIEGIRENTGNHKKIVKRELGDERVANILDAAYDYVAYQGNFDEISDESFDSMLKAGAGLRKLGYDPTASGGEGEIFGEFVNIEDAGWSKCKSKQLDDARWVWTRTIMDWEDAMMIAPEKAGILKGIKSTLSTEWELRKTGNNKGVFARDYENLIVTHAEGAYKYPDYVEVWEFWIKRRMPVKQVGGINLTQDEFGNPQAKSYVNQMSLDYQVQDGETELGTKVIEQWERYVVATSGGRTNATLLKNEVSEFPFHPFVLECAARKKSGAPFGFVEQVMPAQKRINISWAQKMAFNNKAIKAPLIAREGSIDIEQATQTSQLGAILFVKQGYEMPIVNQVPQVNLQAIEEGNQARQDMSVVAFSTEPVLRGQAGTSESGVKLSLQQSSAITPMNKWVKAERLSELSFSRKALYIMIKKFPAKRLARILGNDEFLKLAIGKLDPVTHQPTEPPLQFNPDGTLPIEVEHYDVVIQDSALSDFNKQQTFNAVMALQGLDPMGMFDDEFLIKSAPIKDVDAALASNEAKKSDVIQQLQQVIQSQQQQIQILAKEVDPESPLAPVIAGVKKGKNGNGGKPNQHSNAQKGRSASQSGQQSMIGGGRYASGNQLGIAP